MKKLLLGIKDLFLLISLPLLFACLSQEARRQLFENFEKIFKTEK